MNTHFSVYGYTFQCKGLHAFTVYIYDIAFKWSYTWTEFEISHGTAKDLVQFVNQFVFSIPLPIVNLFICTDMGMNTIFFCFFSAVWMPLIPILIIQYIAMHVAKKCTRH